MTPAQKVKGKEKKEGSIHDDDVLRNHTHPLEGLSHPHYTTKHSTLTAFSRDLGVEANPMVWSLYLARSAPLL